MHPVQLINHQLLRSNPAAYIRFGNSPLYAILLSTLLILYIRPSKRTRTQQWTLSVPSVNVSASPSSAFAVPCSILTLPSTRRTRRTRTTANAAATHPGKTHEERSLLLFWTARKHASSVGVSSSCLRIDLQTKTPFQNRCLNLEPQVQNSQSGTAPSQRVVRTCLIGNSRAWKLR